ncbi:MAG: tetratricopeptide repeat protein [Bacteroidetes bacterium]|nr:tetratricopeptide repeat protein [Bacteroidota bacterium]
MKNGKHFNFVILFCILFFLHFHYASRAQISNAKKIIPPLAVADSLYYEHDWKNALSIYKEILSDTSSNAIAWNRMGFCYYNLNQVDAAKKAYLHSLDHNPSPLLKQVVMIRLARVYAREKKYDEAINSLDIAAQTGYANADEMDSLNEFNSIRSTEKYKEIRRKVFVQTYPCTAEPKSTDFDFWIGKWNAYITGTHILAGHSIIQPASGGCMILENWSSANNSYNGKSINFYDPSKDKWEQIWVGSEGGPDRVHRFYNGEYRDSAMRFEYTSTGNKGETVTGRFTFFNEGKNQVRQLKESSLDNAKTWQIDYDFTYVRVE